MHMLARVFSAALPPLAAALVLTLAGPAGAACVEPTGPIQPSKCSVWPMYQHDAFHSGQSGLPGPVFPPGGPDTTQVKKWQGFDKFLTSFALSPDNQTLYAGLGFDICALRVNDMTRLWCVRLDADVSAATPVVDQHGDVYLADRDNSVTKFNTDPSLVCPVQDTKLKCRKIWQYNHGHEGDVWTSPVLYNGAVYFANNQSKDGFGVVTALNAVDGTVKWKYVIGTTVQTSSPAIDKHGTVYLGDTQGVVHAFRGTDGVRLWKTAAIGTSIGASPVISADSKTLFVGSSTGLVAIDLCGDNPPPLCVPGTQLWTFPTNGAVNQTPALAANGTLYFGAKLGSIKTLYALNPGVPHQSQPPSAPKWTNQIASGSANSAFPIVGLDGTVYVGRDRGVSAFDANGTLLWSFTTQNFIISSPIIGPNATLYLGSGDWKLYALSSGQEGTVPGPNHPPTAQARATPPNAVPGQSVVFSGSASSDPDGDPLSYHWDFSDGFTAPGPTVTRTDLTTNADGTARTYLATLTVSDGQASDDAQVPVTVSPTGSDGAVSFTDGFNRPDSTLLNDPNNALGPQQWTEAKGDLVISGYKLKNTGKGDSVAIVDLSGATHAEAWFTSVDNNWGPRLGVVLGYQDPLNYYLLYRIAGGTAALRISKVANGVETVLASKSFAAPVVNTRFRLKGEVSGTSLTVTIGPPGQTPTATLSVTSSTFAPGSPGILLGASFALQYSADDFSVATQ